MKVYICAIWLLLLILTVVYRVQGQATERPVIPAGGGGVAEADTQLLVPRQGLCRDGWARGSMRDRLGDEIPVCIKINPNQETWTEAQSTCRKQYGFMLKLDSQVTVNEADIYSVLHSNGVTEFWTGLHTEHGHLVWDDLLPNQLRPNNSGNTTFIRPWSWNNDLTGNQQRYCGRMHIEADDNKRRRKRSPDDDSNDNIFPGLNLANFRHRINNAAFGRRTNRYPQSSPFETLLARQQMSDQLAELPGMDLPSSNSQSESNNPESESQSGSVTTDTPTFGRGTTFDTESDNVPFGADGQNNGADNSLITSVKNLAATLQPGMALDNSDSLVKTPDGFDNDSPSSFDNQPSDAVVNSGSEGTQITGIGGVFGSAMFDPSVSSDDKTVTVESDNFNIETEATKSPFFITNAAGVTTGDDNDKKHLTTPSTDESNVNIDDLVSKLDDSKSTINDMFSNMGDNLNRDNEGSSNTMNEQIGNVMNSDLFSNIRESLSTSDDSKSTNDVRQNEMVDTVMDKLNDAIPDVTDIIDNVAVNVMPSNDDNNFDKPSVNPAETLSEGIFDAVDSSDKFPSTDDLLSDDNNVDINSNSNIEPNKVLYPSLEKVADTLDEMKDKIDDLKSNVNEGTVDGVFPSVDDNTPDVTSDDLNNNDDQILPGFPSLDNVVQPDIPSINPDDMLDKLNDRLDDIRSEGDSGTFDDASELPGFQNGNSVDDLLNPDDTSDDGITSIEDFGFGDDGNNNDKTESPDDLNDNNDDKDSRFGQPDLSDVMDNIQDNIESNTERHLENINDLSEQLSDHETDSHHLDVSPNTDDTPDFDQPKISTDDFIESMLDRDNNDLQEFAENSNPDVTETPDDFPEINQVGNDENVPDDIRDDFNEKLSEFVRPKTDLSYIKGLDKNGQHIQDDEHELDNTEFEQNVVSDNNDDDNLQDVIDTTDSSRDLEHDDKDRLAGFEVTTQPGRDFEIETKRDLDWPEADDLQDDGQDVERDNGGIISEDKGGFDDDLKNKNHGNRQTVVDGNFGLIDNDNNDDLDEMNGEDDQNEQTVGDAFNRGGNGNTVSPIADEQDEDDDFDDVPGMSENVVEDSLRHSLSTMLDAEMTLSTCDTKLPSVCFSYEVLVSSGASTCDAGWYGHVLLDTCYKVLDRKMSYSAAVSRCESLNARVIIANTEFERKYSLMTVQQDGRHFRGGRFWMESPSEKTNCKFFTERGVQTMPNCRAAMNVICVKDTKALSVYSTNQFPHDTSGGRFYDDNGDYVMMTSRGNNSLPCRLTSGASEFPVLWFKDGVMISSKDKHVSPDLSLHINEDLLSSFRLVTDRPLTIPTLQGQYWCEVWDRQTLTRMRSRSFNVRFTDVISFHGSMEVEEFNQENEVLFNMMNREFPRLSAVEDDLQTVFKDELSSVKAYVPNVESVSTFIDGIRSDRPVIEYHTFFKTSRDYTSSDEQLLYKRIKSGLLSKLGNRNYIMNLPGRTPTNSFRTMSLQSTVSCPKAVLQTNRDIYGTTIPVREYSFPTTMLGEFANSLQNCSETNPLPAGSARCLGDFYTGAFWSEVVAYECIEEIKYDQQNVQQWAPSPYTDELSNLAKATADSSNAEKLVQEVAQIAKVAPKFTPSDINKIADVLEHTTKVRNLPKKVGENVLKTVDRLMADSYNEAHVANVETKAANRIIQSLERFAENADLENKQHVRFVSDNVAVEIWDLQQAGKPVIGLAVETSSDGVSQSFKTDSIATVYNKTHLYEANVDAAIELPEEVFSKKEKGARVSDRLTMIVYRQSKLFQAAITDGGRRISPTDQQMQHLNSYIISASIAGKKIEDLNERVKCIFKPKKVSDGQNKCVWWDFTMNDNKGGWSSMGCVYDGMVNGRDVCLCNHLTNFAVLIDFYGQGKPIPDHHELSLSIITVLGLSCSILGLSLTIISFLFFRKLRQGRAQQTLFNLSLSLLLSMLVFLVGIKQTHNDYVCIVVAIMLHYLILVSFMWMLMEAILQYLTFVKILGTYITRFMLKTVLPAWGLPLLPVISVLSIDYTLYKGGPDYCWMDLSVFYYAFAVPVTLIIIINISIFIITIISIFRRGKGLRSNQKKQKMAMTNLQAALTSFILLGLTWIFGYLAISDARLLFQYVFTILNSLQGFFIFILFVVRKKKVRDQWYIICCRGNEKDRVSRSLSASNSIPSTYSNGSRNSRKEGRERDRSDSTKTIQSTYSNSSNGFTNYGYDHSYEFPFSRHDRRAFRNF